MFYEYADAEIRFLQLHPGGDRNFSYILGDAATGAAAAVDPGFNPGLFLSESNRLGLEIRCILLTHGHSDHAGAAAELGRLAGAKMYTGGGEGIENAVVLDDGEQVSLGERAVRAIATPGHTAGHLCFLFENRLITGDLLFCGKVGGTGTHFPGSSASAEWDSLGKIMQMPDTVMVFPGHDYYGGEGTMPYSTIGDERLHNPFLLCRDFAAFSNLKDTWADYKAEHGIR